MTLTYLIDGLTPTDDVSRRYPDLLAQIRRQQAEEAASKDKAAMTTSDGTLGGMPAQASSIEAH